MLAAGAAAAQWPTTCVELNDIVEAHLGNDGSVGIYQRVFGNQAEAACQNDHRADVQAAFAWAIGSNEQATAPAPPAPATTPAPPPAPTADLGYWDYYGPDCPGAYPNCASFASDRSFISLEAHYDTNESFYDDARLRVSCSSRGYASFTFNGGGPWIGLQEGGTRVTIGQDDGQWFEPSGGSDNLQAVWFDRRDSTSILNLIAQAEQRSETLEIGAGSGISVVVAVFDVTGYAANRSRLNC